MCEVVDEEKPTNLEVRGLGIASGGVVVVGRASGGVGVVVLGELDLEFEEAADAHAVLVVTAGRGDRTGVLGLAAAALGDVVFAEVALDEFEHAGEGGIALEDVLLAADVVGLAEEDGVVDAGDEEDGEVLVGGVSADGLEHGDAVDAGHQHVEEHQVDLAFGEALESFEAVPGFDDLVAFVLEERR